MWPQRAACRRSSCGSPARALGSFLILGNPLPVRAKHTPCRRFGRFHASPKGRKEPTPWGHLHYNSNKLQSKDWIRVFCSFGNLHKTRGDILFYENFDALCTKSGKSKSEVTEAIGLTAKSCTGWKNGAVPRNGTLKKIADYFGITVEELMGTKK